MSSILRISEAVSLALHASAVLASRPDELLSTHELAEMLGISEAHLSKVLQRLAHTGLVRGSRGPKGGFTLSRESEKISLLEVYEAIEGPMQTMNCLYDTTICNRNGCIFGGLLSRVSQEVWEYFANTNLHQLSETIGNPNGQVQTQNHSD